VYLEHAVEDLVSGEVSVVISGTNATTGKVFSFPVKREMLLPTPNNPVLRQLLNHGVDISLPMSKALLDFLASYKPKMVIKGFRQIGWVATLTRRLFVLPQCVIGAADGEAFQFIPMVDSRIHQSIKERGTLEEWQRNVMSAAIGNPLVLFMLGVAFLAPLLELLGLEGGVIHLAGGSSSGKTTLAQACVSVYGVADDPASNPESMMQSWHVTGNAIEGMATACNDLVLGLDELGINTSPALSQLAYGLANGTGKQTMTRNREMRKQNNWKVQVVSTGEHTYSAAIEEVTKKQARTGQLIRVISIPVDGGIFPAWSDAERAKRVTQLKEATAKFYGTAKLPYLSYLVEMANQPDQLEGLQKRFWGWIETVMASTQVAMDAAQQRAAKRFAAVAVALELAREAGLHSFSCEEIKASVMDALHLWLADTVAVSETDRGVEHLKQFILRNPNRFADVHADSPRGINLAGYVDAEKGYI